MMRRPAPNADAPAARDHALAEARTRLSRLEAEAHRLRAKLARLEADGDDEAARRMEQRLAALEAEESLLRQPSGADRVAAPAKPSPRRERGSKGAPPGEKAAPSTPPGAKGRERAAPSQAKRPPLWRCLRTAPPWLASLLLHAGLLVVFFLWTFSTFVEPPRVLLGSAPEAEDYEDEVIEVDFAQLEVEPIEINPVEVEPLDAQAVSSELLDNPLDAAAGLTDNAPGMAALPSDAGALLLGAQGGARGAGRRGDKRGGGRGAGGARFFGAQSAGDRFVFVVDNSASMVHGRMETTLMEIQRSVAALQPDQSFYVILYSDQVYPLFFPEPAEGLVLATRENKQKLAQWLQTVEVCVGGEIRRAMKLAASLEPSAVYLLSDGAMADAVAQSLAEADGWNFTVHTFGMTVRNPQDAGKLMAIAGGHRGRFTPVGINPLAAQMAQQRPLPRHTKAPGRVWGTKVGRRP